MLAACQLSALSLLCIGYPGLSPAPRLQPAGPTVAAAPTRQFAILRTRSRDRWAPRSPEVSPVAPARAARTRTIGRVYKGTGGRKDHCRGSLEIHRSRPGLGERWIGVGAGAGGGVWSGGQTELLEAGKVQGGAWHAGFRTEQRSPEHPLVSIRDISRSAYPPPPHTHTGTHGARNSPDWKAG